MAEHRPRDRLVGDRRPAAVLDMVNAGIRAPLDSRIYVEYFRRITLISLDALQEDGCIAAKNHQLLGSE